MSARVALALWLVASAAWADEPKGFAEVRLSWFPGAAGDKLQLVERVRPSFQVDLHQRVKLVATVEAALAEGRDGADELARTLSGSQLGPLLEAAGYRPPTYANQVLRIGSASDYLDVDRLYLDLYSSRIDVRVGRQALNWGSAKFFNPTDPFPQVLLTEPWRPRRGVNAVRATVPFGATTDVTAVVAANDTFTAARVTGRARVNVKGVDLAAVGAWRGDVNNGFVGVDVRGTALVGFWFEGAWMFSARPHEEFSAGVDYSFPVLEQLVVFAQYSRNGGGLSSPDRYPSLASRLGGALPGACTTGASCPAGAPVVDPFAPFTVGRDYLLVGASLGLTPELSCALTALQNLDDGTALLLPSASWAVLDWLDLSASVSIPTIVWGRGGEFKPRPADLVLTLPDPDAVPRSANLQGLMPAVTATLWTRLSF